MRYAFLIYENEALHGSARGQSASPLMARHVAFGQDLGDARLGGAGLKTTASATTVRTSGDRQTVHDGPFAETREQLGGFYLVEAADLDAAIALARKVPLSADGAVEIRPVLGGA